MPLSRTARALGATTLALTLGLTAVGCGDDEPADSPETSATEHNEADVRFATDMMQHHAQALVMVDLTMGRPLSPEVERLAEDIRTAQGPEIETFTDWLSGWDEEVPETVRDHANAGHDMGDMEGMDGMDDMGESMEEMPGMMTADQMAALSDASDGEFEDRWLELMIDHHTGAVEMARTEQEEGEFRPAVDLAGDIAASQSEEIETMRELLDS